MEYSHSSFIAKKPTKVLQNKVILPILVGILVIGITQFSFAEEAYQETSYIAVDEEKFEQPQSRYNYQEITIIGHIADYNRGENVTIVIISPLRIRRRDQHICFKERKYLHTTSHNTGFTNWNTPNNFET